MVLLFVLLTSLPTFIDLRLAYIAHSLAGWRSKYVVSADAITDVLERQCPCCRATIPPSKEQVSILKATRSLKQTCEERGDQNTPEYTDYRQICEDLKKIEAQIGKVCLFTHVL